MSQANPKNLPASVRARLQNISQQREIPFDLILARFAVERLLYRLSRSKHANQFLLKGAMLFAIWTPEAHRPTRDVDLLGFGSTDLEEVKAVFAEICGVSVSDDGLQFKAETLDVSYIREEAHYGGVRVSLRALLGNVRIPVQIDIGFGDVITPGPEIVTFPGLLDFEVPQLRAYPVYTVVAEKFEAIVSLGETNSRMKDFYDLWFLCQRFDFEGTILSRAILATFARRDSQLKAVEAVVGLSDSYIQQKETAWKRFLQRNRIPSMEFAEVVTSIRLFLGPLLSHGHPDQLGSWRADEQRWRI